MKTEQDVKKLARLKIQKQGGRLWVNNVGAAIDHRGIPVRYGLCNESKSVNKMHKSGDLIGITPYIIRPEDVGRTIGVFTSVECKEPGWKYKGDEHEQAQYNWIKLVNSLGGIAYFFNGE